MTSRLDSDIHRPDDATRAHEVKRVTWIGFVINLVLATFELVAGIVGASQVVVADAMHSFSDSTTDVAVLVGVHYWAQPPDDRHPYGHGRIETVVTVLIGVALLGVAIGLTWNAIVTLGGVHRRAPGLIGAAAALVLVVSKEALYRWTMAVGRRIGSQALIAKAWHHRSDALSSVPTVIAVMVARINQRWLLVDHVGAVVVSAFIFQVGLKVAWPALQELIDAGASAQELKRIREIVLATAGVREVHAVRTRAVGGMLNLDLHVLVDPGMTVREGHDISEKVTARLLGEGPRLADVVVHIEPDEGVTGGPSA